MAEIFKSENIWALDYVRQIFNGNKAAADASGNKFLQTAGNIRNLIRYISENTNHNPGRQKRLIQSCYLFHAQRRNPAGQGRQ